MYKNASFFILLFMVLWLSDLIPCLVYGVRLLAEGSDNFRTGIRNHVLQSDSRFLMLKSACILLHTYAFNVE